MSGRSQKASTIAILGIRKAQDIGADSLPYQRLYENETALIIYTTENNIKASYKDIRIIGYFLEGVQESGVVGPHPEIHPDGRSGISLNRDLRYHFANLYRVSYHLRKAIERTIKRLHGVKLSRYTSSNRNIDQSKIELVAERIFNLPRFYFENELQNKTPDIYYSQNSYRTDLSINFPGSKGIRWEGKMLVTVQTRAEKSGHRMPYFKCSK